MTCELIYENCKTEVSDHLCPKSENFKSIDFVYKGSFWMRAC